MEMKIKTLKIGEFFDKEKIEVIKNFIGFLMNQVPLKEDINIHFLAEKSEEMTTGVRYPPHDLYVLAKGRMLVDVLRTLCHEWMHEFEHQKMGLPEDGYPEVGGPIENVANILTGILVKRFQYQNPKFEEILYRTD